MGYAEVIKYKNMQSILIMVLFMTTTAPSYSCKTAVPLNKEVSLKYGQTLEIREEKLKIRFASVAEDSRCPRGEQCIRAGNAAVVLEIAKQNSKMSSITLNTSNEPQEVSYENLGVGLIGLQPQPKSGFATKPSDYVITLRIYKTH